MLREVQAFDFIFTADSQTNREVDNLEQDKRSDDRKGPCNGNTDELVEHLVPVTLDDAGGKRCSGPGVLEDGVDQARSKDPGEDCAEGSPCP